MDIKQDSGGGSKSIYDLLLQTKKTYNEFYAFHMALTQKFKTLAITAMPPDPTFARQKER